MEDKLTTVDQLRRLRADLTPINGDISADARAKEIHYFIGKLLDVIEAQDARIKALEEDLAEVLDRKRDQDTENWAHGETRD